MSQFYGTVDGRAPTKATRTGDKDSGIRTTAASWKGAIEVHLWEDSEGRERYRIRRIPWQGSGSEKARLIEEGEL